MCDFNANESLSLIWQNKDDNVSVNIVQTMNSGGVANAEEMTNPEVKQCFERNTRVRVALRV